MSDSDMAKRIKELRLSLGLTLEEVANEAGSFNYEFVCDLGKALFVNGKLALSQI